MSSDLTDLMNINYDIFVFYSPSCIKSLFQNFPDFKQDDIKIASFGNSTAKAVKDAGLRLDIQAPLPQFPSMTMALEHYIKDYNKNEGKNGKLIFEEKVEIKIKKTGEKIHNRSFYRRQQRQRRIPIRNWDSVPFAVQIVLWLRLSHWSCRSKAPCRPRLASTKPGCAIRGDRARNMLTIGRARPIFARQKHEPGDKGRLYRGRRRMAP